MTLRDSILTLDPGQEVDLLSGRPPQSPAHVEAVIYADIFRDWL